MNDAKAEAIALLEQASNAMGEEWPRMRKKLILGGPFGSGGFKLASMSLIDGGLHRVCYFVFHDSGLLIGYGANKPEALHMARGVLTGFDKGTIDTLFAKFHAKQETRLAAEREALREAAEEDAERRRASRQKVSSIPRRRQRIFDESEGKCHYCATPLTLDGKWHIEHKMPKALMGGDEPGNLVASCVTCNHRKRDKTDVEFKAKLAKESAA